MTDFLFERITQTLAANQELKRAISATEFRVVAALWPLTVQFMRRGQVVGEVVGMLAGDYARGMEYDAFVVKNGAVAQIVVLGVSRGTAGSDRITGQVEVIDGGRAKVLSGASFVAAGGVGPVAGQYSYMQLHNPAGSGKSVFVYRVSMSADQAAVSVMRKYNTALATDYGTGHSKKLGGTASLSRLRATTDVAILGAPTIYNNFFQAQQANLVRLEEPILLTEGSGIITTLTLPNSALYTNFEYAEESVT